MDNERDDWAQASETVLIFDQWMRAIVGTLRAERGATINQFWLLLLISERPQQSAATAAATLGLNYTTVAACAAQLVRKGALEKRTCDDDNRYSPLAITPAGQRLLASLDQSLITAAKSALDPLQDNERTQALQLFLRSLRAAQQEADDGRSGARGQRLHHHLPANGPRFQPSVP